MSAPSSRRSFLHLSSATLFSVSGCIGLADRNNLLESLGVVVYNDSDVDLAVNARVYPREAPGSEQERLERRAEMAQALDAAEWTTSM